MRREFPPSLLFLVTAVLCGTASAEPDRRPAPGSMNRVIRADVAAARAIALRKLESPTCRMVFSDFADSEGRSLRSNLETRGETAADLMRRLTFLNGSGESPCKHDGVLAFTTPRTTGISICGPAFRKALRNQPDLAANILIHEELHSLGLQELSRFARPPMRQEKNGNRPPTSSEINDGVAARCGL